MLMLCPQRSRHFPKYLITRSQPFSSLSSLLGFCNTTQLLQQIHARFILQGLHQNTMISSELINRYGDIDHLDCSRRVFQSIADPDACLYNAIIKQLSAHGEAKRTLNLYLEMLEKSLCPDESAYCFVTKSCADLHDLGAGRKIHCHVIKLGAIYSCVHLGSSFVEMYLKFGEISNAHHVIESMSVRNLFAWNALISGGIQYGDPVDSFKLFERMRLEGLEPDSVTIVSLLRLCADLKCSEAGQLLHGLIVVNGFGGDLSVCTALLTMYSKLGILQMARLVFDGMPLKDSVIWNVMISGYSQKGSPKQALELLIEMGKLGVRADLFTAITTLSSVAELKCLELGEQIHGHVIRHGSNYQVSVHNSLIEMYSKCKSLDSARKVFDLVTKKSVVTWSSMIKGYASHDQFAEALVLFDEMRADEVRPDAITLIDVLPACVHLAALERVKIIHGYSIKEGFSSDNSVVTALLVAYAKCGCIEMAQKLFDEEDTSHKDTVSWNSMIGAYSKHGNWSRCLDLYNRMKNSNVMPDRLTFLGLLITCVNSGLVKEGWECFNEMVETHRYRPEQEHYACMVDLLGRSGHLDEAAKLIRTMPFEPDTRVWGPLLSACKLHSETKLGEFAAQKLIDMDPKNAGNYVLLSNIYAAAGKWDGVANMRNFLRSRGLKKTPGCSWLEINRHVHEFRVADRSHPQSEEIYMLLRIIKHESKMDADIRTELLS